MLQAWGSGMSQQQRMQIDAVTAHIASTASSAADHISQSFEGSCNQAGALAVQLAALKALLASILSPAPHRPSFLPQALTLFTQVLILGQILQSCFHRAHMVIAAGIYLMLMIPTQLCGLRVLYQKLIQPDAFSLLHRWFAVQSYFLGCTVNWGFRDST